MQSNPFASYFEQFSKNAYQGFPGSHMETLIEMNGITTRLYSELTRQNLRLINRVMQCGFEEMQDLTQARGFDDALKVMSQSASKISPPILEHAQSVMDALINTAGEYNRLLEEGMAKTTKTINKFADKTRERSQQASA
jgi:hypothetical protein